MKTASELLDSAPAYQETRCKLAWKAIAAGCWEDAAHHLRNAAADGAGPEYWHWATAVQELAAFCESKAKGN